MAFTEEAPRTGAWGTQAATRGTYSYIAQRCRPIHLRRLHRNSAGKTLGRTRASTAIPPQIPRTTRHNANDSYTNDDNSTPRHSLQQAQAHPNATYPSRIPTPTPHPHPHPLHAANADTH
jgi:hypothetical protein